MSGVDIDASYIFYGQMRMFESNNDFVGVDCDVGLSLVKHFIDIRIHKVLLLFSVVNLPYFAILEVLIIQLGI